MTMNIKGNFIIMLCALLSVAPQALAQTDERLRAIVRLTGAGSEEELDESEIERYTVFLSHPLEINTATGSRMLSSGLLSQYQIASLIDYRTRTGDILSFSELASVEGFGEDAANALKPFISLRGRSLPGQPYKSSRSVSNEALARFAVKGDEYNYGAKYRLGYGDAAELSLAARTKYSDKEQFPPSAWSANIVYYGKKRLGKVIVGDFNARFGQGLALWSGMSLSSLSSSASFSKRPSGISPSWSWSGIGSHRGVAADFSFGRFVVSSLVSFPGLRTWCESGKKAEISSLTGGNVAYYGRQGQFSLTGYCLTDQLNMSGKPIGGKVSGDFRYSWRGVDMFGEAVYDFLGNCAGFVTGAVVPLGDDWRLSSVIRYYPADFSSDYTGGVRSWTKASDEAGVAVGVERSGIVATVDYAMKDGEHSQRQLKVLLKAPLQLSGTSVLTVRITERFRPYEEILKYRTGARCDLDWSSSGLSARYGPPDKPAWKMRVRTEGLLCRSLAGLGYVEGGRKTEGFSAYLRGTIFIVDDWDDRIYSYERDAPGNFTVPAYYGRGWSASLVAGSKFRFGAKKTKALKCYLRASTVRYSFMKEPKRPSSEAKVQLVLYL